MCTYVTNKSEYVKSLQVIIVHSTVGLTESSLSIKNTSFCLSRDNKYLLMVLLVGLRHVLWSQSRSPLKTWKAWVSTSLWCWNRVQMDIEQITVSEHSPISLWFVRIFAVSHSEIFLVILYSLRRLDSAFLSLILSSSIWDHMGLKFSSGIYI